MNLILLDELALIIVGGLKHTAHGGDKKTSRTATRVEDDIIGLEVDEVAEQFGDVSRGQDYAQALPVAAAVADEFAVEASEVIFRRIAYNRVENVIGNELRKKFERRLAEVAVDGVEQRAVFNQAELTEHAFLLDFGADVGAL